MTAVCTDSATTDLDIAEHIRWCRDMRGLTEGTIRVRTSVLLGLREVLGRPLREATTDDLIRWQLAVSTGNAATRNAYTSHAASFYAWLVDTGVIAENPASGLTRVKVPRPRAGRTRTGRAPGPELLEQWARAMRAAGRSQRTVTDWPKVIELVARRTGQHPAEFTTDALAGVLAALPSAGTRCAYWGALRSWHRWLVDVEELRADNPMRKLQRPKGPRRRPRPVSTAQLQRILDSGIRRRTRTWILLAALQGLRVHEIAKVRGEDVDLEAQRLRVIGKGGVDAELPLHPLVAAEAERYPRAGYWFPSYEGYSRALETVHPNTVSSTVSRAMDRAGIPCTAHQLRHWFGTNTLRTAKGNLRVAQDLLRHASIATTALYTQIDDTDRRAALTGLTIDGAA
jgi:integrase/recombinase XerD